MSDLILTEEELNNRLTWCKRGFDLHSNKAIPVLEFCLSLLSANAELSFKNQKYKELCERVMAYVEPQVDQSGYGAFPGGNPNLFTPDSENSEEEINNWKLACEKWNAGNHEGEQGSHRWLTDAEGNVMGTATVAKLGFGIYMYEDEEALDIVEEIKALEELNHE